MGFNVFKKDSSDRRIGKGNIKVDVNELLK